MTESVKKSEARDVPRSPLWPHKTRELSSNNTPVKENLGNVTVRRKNVKLKREDAHRKKPAEKGDRKDSSQSEKKSADTWEQIRKKGGHHRENLLAPSRSRRSCSYEITTASINRASK